MSEANDARANKSGRKMLTDKDINEILDAIEDAQKTGLTYRQVANALGRSQGQVAGVVFRFGEYIKTGEPRPKVFVARRKKRGPKPKPGKKKVGTKVTRTRKNKILWGRFSRGPSGEKQAPMVMPDALADAPKPKGGDTGCRWLHGKEVKDFVRCGHREHPGRPYCEYHCNRAYVILVDEVVA